MARIGLKQIGIALGSRPGFYVEVGIALNRLNHYWINMRATATNPVTKKYYEKLGLWINILGGTALAVVGAMAIGTRNTTTPPTPSGN